MSARSRSLGWSVAVIALVFVFLQLAVLPPDGFFCGDQGAKYLQALAFAEHGPLHPGIDVGASDIDPDFRYQEPILTSREGRLIAAFSWLLPILTAPFLYLLGLRGLYVVPALSAIAIFLGAAALGRRLGVGSGLWSAWTVLLAAPVLFYGAELWEHAPAAAGVVIAAVLFAPGERQDWRRIAGGGACLAIAALFREEAMVALPAFLVARAVSVERGGRIRNVLTTAPLSLLGVAAVFLASVPMNLVVYGSAVPLHLSAEIGKMSSYWETRRLVVTQVLLPDSYLPAFASGVACALLASAAVARRRRSERRPDIANILLFAMTLASAATLAAIAVVIPLWRQIAAGVAPYWAYRIDSIAQTWPFWIVLVCWPLAGTDEKRKEVGQFLMLSALLLVAGTLAIIPSAGGAQWSPRYLFVAAPLLALLSSAVAFGSAAAESTFPRITMWSARVILLLSVATQAGGLLYLIDAKARNARITDRIGFLVGRGEVMITNVYWIPEVAATLLPTRRVLFVPPSLVPGVATLAARQGQTGITLVTTHAETGYDAPDFIDAAQAGCRFRRVLRVSIRERGLMFDRYNCEGP